MKILIINGPNLNLLGTREVQIYGKTTLSEICEELKDSVKGMELEFFQSNHEGEIVDAIQKAAPAGVNGIVINPAAYTHTSVAIADAIAAVGIPTVEVHLSNVHAREEYRKHSFCAPKCIGQISGFGPNSYKLGLYALVEHIKSSKTEQA
jgi:3-dehydroquinate dehydratase-2